MKIREQTSQVVLGQVKLSHITQGSIASNTVPIRSARVGRDVPVDVLDPELPASGLIEGKKRVLLDHWEKASYRRKQGTEKEQPGAHGT